MLLWLLLVLLLLILAPQLPLLVRLYQLLLLTLLDLNVLLLLLFLQPVLFQLESKVNNYFFQQINKLQDPDQLLPSQSLKTLTSTWLRQ